MATLIFSNNAAAELAQGISALDTSMTVKAGQGAYFPTPAANQYFVLTLQSGATWEIVHCITRVGDVFSIVRAQEGTTGVNFPIGAVAEQRVTAGVLRGFLQEETIQDINGFLPLDGSKAMTGTLQVAPPAASATIVLNSTPKTNSNLIYGRKAGVERWILALGDNAVESDVAKGSNLAIYRYNNLGAWIDTALWISRETGDVTLGGNLNISQSGNAQIVITAKTSGYSSALFVDNSDGSFGIWYGNGSRRTLTVTNYGAVTAPHAVISGQGQGFRSDGLWGGTEGYTATWLVRSKDVWGADGDSGIQMLHVPGSMAGVRIYMKPWVYDFRHDGTLQVPKIKPVDGIIMAGDRRHEWQTETRAGFPVLSWFIDSTHRGYINMVQNVATFSITSGEILNTYDFDGNYSYYQGNPYGRSADVTAQAEPTVDALAVVKLLKLRSFTQGSKANAGALLVDEVEAVDPSLVIETGMGHEDGTITDPRKIIDMNALVFRLLGAIQALEARLP